jgi:phage protein D
MAFTSLREPGLPSTDYYAPNYQIEIEGLKLDPETKGDVLDLKVVMDMDQMTSFEFNLSNWDDKHLEFKYSDNKTFTVGNRVHLQMGYADRMLSMAVGQISALAPKFPESGAPTINITGLDGMLKLRDRKPKEGEQVKYQNMADWEIAQAIAARNKLKSTVDEEGEVHELVVQKNQDDAAFLKERAARADRDCFILTDPDTGEDTLYFIRPLDGRESRRQRVYVFEWGKTLVNFSPTLTLSRQVSKVTVRGWNPRTKAAITFTAGPEHLPGKKSAKGTSGPEAANQSLNGKQEVVIDAPVLTEEEAKDLAISLLAKRAYEFITGHGQVIGLPDLRPGDTVDLQKLGTRFSGEYYVKKVEHTLGSNGYLTSFDVRKTHDGGSK